MPVYNSGIYLKEALESIFVQTFCDYEIICIDDYSNDDLTKEILKKYQSAHKNMQVIRSEKRLGAGKARNLGFKEATGEYIIFLDADDIFSADFLEKMYQCICENNADVCICGFEVFYTRNNKKYVNYKWLPNDHKISEKNSEEWILNIPTSAWNKLCKREYLKKYNILFQSLPSCNDVYFSCRVLLDTKRISCIDRFPLISYRINNESQISANRNPRYLYDSLLYLYEVEQRNCDRTLLLQWMAALLLKNGIAEIEKCNSEFNKAQYYNLLRNFFKNNKITFQNMVLESMAEKFKMNSCEYGLLDNKWSFLNQLRLTAQKWKKEITEEKIFLWGMGKRGEAFQKLCKEQGIILHGVTDIKNRKIGEKTEYGYKILDKNEVLRSNGLIIASNNIVYNYLSKMNLNLLNLEKYCPF